MEADRLENFWKTIPIISIQEWLTNYDAQTLLDLRKQPKYWLKHAVHLPTEELQPRSFELPPRHTPMIVLLDREACETFYEAHARLVRQTGKQKPWRIRAAVVDSDPNRIQALQLDLLTTKPDLNQRLWNPDSLVEHHLLPQLQLLLTSGSNQQSQGECHEIWDLGAGFGRDVCFLAQELQKSLIKSKVVAMDQRYRDLADDATVQFLRRQQVDQCTAVEVMDLRDTTTVLQNMEARKPFCVYAVRYWNSALFSAISQSHHVQLVAVSTFGKEFPGLAWPFAHPKPKHVLERYELRDMFNDWEILRDDVVRDNDHGRTLIQFVALRQRCA